MVALPKLNSSWGICSARVWGVGYEASSERKHSHTGYVKLNETCRASFTPFYAHMKEDLVWFGWGGLGVAGSTCLHVGEKVASVHQRVWHAVVDQSVLTGAHDRWCQRRQRRWRQWRWRQRRRR
eukprot:359405-Chlamydomonas_euryale.AAC.2